jgi:hypothetical protein
MSRGMRLGLLAAVIVAAIVGFVIAQPGDDDETKTTTTAPAPPAGAQDKPRKPRRPPYVQIRVVGGKPAGGVRKLKVDKGERVRFVVRSDVTDEVHVHGYDISRDVPAGGSVKFNFPARIDGSFEIELESRQEQIAELEVQP